MTDMTDEEVVHGVAASLLRSMDGRPFEERATMLARALANISQGLITAAEQEAKRAVAPIRASVDKIKDGYVALADVADVARRVVKPLTEDELSGTGALIIGQDRWAAVLELREALARAELATRDTHAAVNEALAEARGS